MHRYRARRVSGSIGAADHRGLGLQRALTTGLATVVLAAGGAAVALATGPAMAASAATPRTVNPVARYLSVSTAHKTATLTLLAGVVPGNGTVSGLDFNGYANGTMTVNVPKGWKVLAHCESRGAGTHSCAIVVNSKAKTPAFRGASDPVPTRGIAAGRTASFTFTPTRLGHFLIASLVSNQTPRGMWDHFNVTTGRVPSITATSPVSGAAEVLKIAAEPDGALRYTQSQLTAPRPGKITIEFTNSAPIAHDFTLATPAGDVIAKTPVFIGGTRSITVTLKAGVYGYYCSVDHHQLAGMEGSLIVK